MQRTPACVSAFAERLSFSGKQHPIERHFAFNDVLVQVQRGQVVCVIVKAKIGWAANQCAPLTYPLPKHIAGVAFEPPHGSVTAVMGEELRQHFLAGANPQELGVCAKLCPVVRGRGGCCAQLEPRIAEC